MEKVESSSLFIRSPESPGNGAFVFPKACGGVARSTRNEDGTDRFARLGSALPAGLGDSACFSEGSESPTAPPAPSHEARVSFVREAATASRL